MQNSIQYTNAHPHNDCFYLSLRDRPFVMSVCKNPLPLPGLPPPNRGKNLPKIKNRLPAHPLLKSHNEVSSGRPYHSRNGFIRCHTEIDTMQRCAGYAINDEHATLLTIVNRCKGVVREPLNKSSAAEQRIFFPIHAE